MNDIIDVHTLERYGRNSADNSIFMIYLDLFDKIIGYRKVELLFVLSWSLRQSRVPLFKRYYLF